MLALVSFAPLTWGSWLKARQCALLLLLLSVSGCVRSYRPPKASEPHAILKLRRTYARVAGDDLSESLLINKRRAVGQQTTSRLARTPQTTAVLVRPEPAKFVASSNFTHYEWRWVYETYYVSEPDYYYNGSRRVHTTRSVPRTHLVQRRVLVTDSTCRDMLNFEPLEGHTYLLQFTYEDDRVCRLSCFEQVPGPDGGFQQVSCDEFD